VEEESATEEDGGSIQKETSPAGKGKPRDEGAI
jgi:hypothetical protein